DLALKAVHRDVLSIDGGDFKRRGHSGARQFDAFSKPPRALVQVLIFLVLPEKCVELGPRGVILVQIGERNSHAVVGQGERRILLQTHLEFVAALGEATVFFLAYGLALQSRSETEMDGGAVRIGVSKR